MLGVSKFEVYGIAIVVLGLLMTGAYFTGNHRGYIEGEQVVQVKFDAFVNDTKAAGLKAVADELAKKQAQDKINHDQEMQHAQADALLNARYNAAASKLRGFQQTAAGSGSGGLQPVPAGASVCNDAAKDKRFLDAFSGYRQSVLGFLQTCESQAAQLTEAQAWIRAQQAVK